MNGGTFLRVWIVVQWLCMIASSTGLSYLLFSDSHGLPTTGFYLLSSALVVASSVGSIVALSAAKSLPEQI